MNPTAGSGKNWNNQYSQHACGSSEAQTNIMNIWLNGALLPQDEAVIAAHSAGATLGWGVFTTIGVWHGRALATERHVHRLRHDAGRLQIALAFEDDVLRQAVADVLHANSISRGIARITALQRGDGRWNTDSRSHTFIMAKPMTEDTASIRGLRLVLSPFRVEARRATAGIKTTSYLDFQMAWQDAARHGFDEALLCNGMSSGCAAACCTHRIAKADVCPESRANSSRNGLPRQA
jgi:branched-chain amino acid aminotransferase